MPYWGMWNYQCPECDTIVELLVDKEKKDVQTCRECGTALIRMPGVPPSWMKDPVRTAAQLKRRSYDHTMRCKEKGIPLDDPHSAAGVDPVWRNKYRAKNTSRQTINQNRYAHQGWNDKPTAEFQLGSPAGGVNLKREE